MAVAATGKVVLRFLGQAIHSPSMAISMVSTRGTYSSKVSRTPALIQLSGMPARSRMEALRPMELREIVEHFTGHTMLDSM